MSTTKLKRNMMETTREKWSFDGHGINITGGERSGERIAKVSLEQYDYSSGTPIRNADFDNTSNIIAAAPDMLEALERVGELATRQIRGGTPEQCHTQLAQLRALIHRTAQAAIAKARGKE